MVSFTCWQFSKMYSTHDIYMKITLIFFPDTNECSKRNGGCQHTCYNTPGSYYCGCPAGLRITNDLRSCEDVNECLLRNGHGPCQDTCHNTYGAYHCSCKRLKGTRLSRDQHTCKDIDECQEGNSGCSHGCVNTLGRVFCVCPEGMQLGKDWKICHGIIIKFFLLILHN